MNNQIKSFLFGSGLIIISLLLFFFRNRLSKVPPNKNKLAYFTEEQTKNKIHIAYIFFFFTGLIVIILTFS